MEQTYSFIPATEPMPNGGEYGKLSQVDNLLILKCYVAQLFNMLSHSDKERLYGKQETILRPSHA